jgi:hypothetical protein
MDNLFIIDRVDLIPEIETHRLCRHFTHHQEKSPPPPFPKDKTLKRGKHCGQHSGDIGIHIWQDKKKVTMILMSHKDEMHHKVNKEETKLSVMSLTTIRTWDQTKCSQKSDATDLLAWVKGRFQVVRKIIQNVIQCSFPYSI